jgi:nitrogen regulatory protein PII
MKRVQAIIRFKLEEAKEALAGLGGDGMTIENAGRFRAAE